MKTCHKLSGTLRLSRDTESAVPALCDCGPVLSDARVHVVFPSSL